MISGGGAGYCDKIETRSKLKVTHCWTKVRRADGIIVSLMTKKYNLPDGFMGVKVGMS